MSDIDGQYLTFGLGDQELGIAILHVQEIVGLLPVTAIPGAPSHVRGVINLRGRLIPAMDLRARFGIGAGGRAATA
jgi:purine-binding chemotaxis protein CheW